MRHLLAVVAGCLLLSSPLVAAAGFGGSVATQRYQPGDAARLTPGLEFVWTHGQLGVQAAGEWTNRSSLGDFTAAHLDLLYLVRLHERLTLTFGAGVTRVHAESTEEGPQTRDTWNAEAELARAFASTDVFLRIRQYDYSFPGFRNQVIGSPAGPAIAVGARFWLR